MFFVASTSGHNLVGIPSNVVVLGKTNPHNNLVIPPLKVGGHYRDTLDGSQMRIVQANVLKPDKS